MMFSKDIEDEIERLKAKKLELTNKINLTSDFEEREDLRAQVKKIEEQIRTLEKFKS